MWGPLGLREKAVAACSAIAWSREASGVQRDLDGARPFREDPEVVARRITGLVKVFA